MNFEDLVLLFIVGFMVICFVSVIYYAFRDLRLLAKGQCDDCHALVLCPNDGDGWRLYPKAGWGTLCFLRSGRHRANVPGKKIYGQGVTDLYSASIEVAFLRGPEFVLQEWKVIVEFTANTVLSGILGPLIKNGLLEKSLQQRLYNFKQMNLEKLVADLTNPEDEEQQEMFDELIQQHFLELLGEGAMVTGRFGTLFIKDVHLLEHLVRA